MTTRTTTTERESETEALWRELHGRLFAFLHSRVASREDAEDLLQDVFARIHARAQMENVESVSGFLFRVARNAVTDYHRRRATAAKASEALAESTPVSRSLEPDDAGAERELASCIEPLVARLPDRYRAALELTELGELTQRQASERLGISLSGVKSRVSRGREKLKELLLDCCHVELDRRKGVAEIEPRKAGPCSCGRGSLVSLSLSLSLDQNR